MKYLYKNIKKEIGKCLFCENGNIVKNGVLKSGGQRYKCKTCEKQFHIGGTRISYNLIFKEKVAKEYLHIKLSARKVAKKYNISTSTLLNRSKQHKKRCKKCI